MTFKCSRALFNLSELNNNNAANLRYYRGNNRLEKLLYLTQYMRKKKKSFIYGEYDPKNSCRDCPSP